MKMIFLYITILFFLNTIFPTSSIPTPEDYVKEYCKSVPCEAKKTLCKRKGYCAPQPGCAMIPSSDDFRKFVVHYHNAMRNRIAMGRDKRSGNSKASRMNALSYDKEIEFETWCHSNQCQFAADDCLADPKHPHMGMNFAMHNKSITNAIDFVMLQHWMDVWYEEIALLGSGNDIDKLPKNDEDTAHFTQLVFETVEYVGCTRNYKNNTDGTFDLYFFCQYDKGPAPGEPVYTRGEPCSKCPRRMWCNRKYFGLCGKSKMDYGSDEYYLYSEGKKEPEFVVEDGDITYKSLSMIEYYDPLTFGGASIIQKNFIQFVLLCMFIYIF